MKTLSRRFTFGLAATVLLSFIGIIAAQGVSDDVKEHSVALGGEWRWRAAESGEGASPDVDDSTWAVVRLPGALSAQGVAGQAWVRRWVEVPEGARGKEHVIVFGDTRSTFVRVFVNGHYVGVDGDAQRLIKDETTTLRGYVVPAEFMPGERALVALRVSTPHSSDWEGINDHRLVLGPSEHVHDWFIRAALFDNLLRTSPIFLSFFLIALLAVLLAIEGKYGDRRRYLNVIAFIAACIFWQLMRSGVFPADVMTRRMLSYFGGLGLVLTSFELAEYHYTGQLNRRILYNRIVIGICALAAFLPFARDMRLGLIAYWLVPVLRTLFLAGRSLIRGPKGLGALLDVGLLLLALIGVNDVLSYLGLVPTPSMFAVGVNYLALISGTLVIGEFVSIAQANQMLSLSLQKTNLQLDHSNRELEKKNRDLAHALEQAQVAVRVKGEFLAKVSHELRTPLNAIINIPEGLLEDFPMKQQARCAACGFTFQFEGDAEQQDLQACQKCQSTAGLAVEALSVEYNGEASRTRSYLDTIRRSGKHLLSVVDDVLDFSKLEAGKLKLQLESIHLQTLINDLERTLRPVAARQHVQLAFPQVGDTRLTADPVKLMQIFINLIGNAIKFSPARGTVEMHHAREGEVHVFSVRDSGIGIAKEHQQFIFEGFRQVEGGNTRRFGGTGLGLTITRELVNLHGGSISLDSELGKGTTFFVRLPVEATRRDAPAEVATVPVGPLAPTSKKRVLVVDDELVVVETLRLALDEQRIELIPITDPRDAVSSIRRLTPDLVILDVMMPRISGVSILGELRDDPALRKVPVLVLSAYSSNREVVSGLGARWLRKPWHRRELDEVIADMLGTGSGR